MEDCDKLAMKDSLFCAEHDAAIAVHKQLEDMMRQLNSIGGQILDVLKQHSYRLGILERKLGVYDE
jgi:chorismate synthase